MVQSSRRWCGDRGPATAGLVAGVIKTVTVWVVTATLIGTAYATAVRAVAAGQESGPGRVLRLADASQLTRLAEVKPGDTILLANGTWHDARLIVTRGGTAAAPVVIKAEMPGGVILDGSSRLSLEAPYVTVDGLWFQGGALDGGAVIQFNSHHGVVRNTAVVDVNPPKFETEYYWVFFNGDDNLVERGYFSGKNHLGPLVGNALSGSRRNTVSQSMFGSIPYAEANGREIFRIWGAGKLARQDDEEGAYFSVEHNLFDHADGEGSEIVSLKSNHNRVVGNTVVDTRGGITIRRGNDNVVKDNVVLGAGVIGAGGIRLTGERNLVEHNYVSRTEYGIRVMSGEFTGSDLTGQWVPDVKRKQTVPTYPQVRDLTLAANVVVGVSGADLDIGFSYKKGWPQSQQVLLPERCTMTGNRFVRPSGGTSVIGTTPDQAPPLDRFHFAPNTYRSNILIGGTNSFRPAQSGFEMQMLPPGWSERLEQAGFVVLTRENVGPEWMRPARAAR